MDGANADSDNSMTWEDFFGSTTDLTPTLIGIYDSFLEPAKSLKSEAFRLETAKDARNDPPVHHKTQDMTEEGNTPVDSTNPTKDPTKIVGSVKLPTVTLNKSTLYSNRTQSDKNGVSVEKSDLTYSDTIVVKENKIQRTFKDVKQTDAKRFDNLSPNVKRMISSSAPENTTLKFQKKSGNAARSSGRYKINIPLVGATSKISQSGVEILPSVEIYDQPSTKSVGKNKPQNDLDVPIKTSVLKPEFKLNEETTYDIPTNNRPTIYDTPQSKTTFETLSLPYIDQSIELSISSNDREFDTKLSPKEYPTKESTPEGSPAKIFKADGGTNSLHRKDFVSKTDGPLKQLTKSGVYPDAVGSTGDLKNVKDTTKLNPPVVEVTRPLSMSSIASSSSTSSSGVQNKGGVNSAYLASIESLDDHSDADMTSANGSNNFVNNAGIPSANSEERSLEKLPNVQAPDEMAGLTQLERVLTEILQTENVYVEDLRQVVEGYLHVWRREATFSEEELSELFNNIEDIYSFNRSLCEELNTCQLDASCIAGCFVSNTAGFAVYTSYCTGYPRTMERLAELASKAHSAREFRDRQVALGHPLPLASYLLKPVQRILKYHLLLQNVVKHSASHETEYALLKMTGIAQHIDDMKRKHEHAVRVQEIQSLLYGWNGPDLTTYGELCAEGTFRVFGAKAMRHAFLFDNMLLITKNREDGVLAYKSHIMCNNLMLVESLAGAPLSFQVLPWDAPRRHLTLTAHAPATKRQWTLLLKRVILENYNAVIPSHARQLVMELGQNKTDDDMLAEKSHNLITQASMRKQLSAPEYLEKRKLERERRKFNENGVRGRLKKPNRKYTVPNSRTDHRECDCVQVSAEKGTDYTCDLCYVDLCSDCETDLGKKPIAKEEHGNCKMVSNKYEDKCLECNKYFKYIDSGSVDRLEKKTPACKCSDFKSSQESFSKDSESFLNKTRNYHSSDNIVGYTDSKINEESNATNNSLTNVRSIPKTCLKCTKIKENIVVTDSFNTLRSRKPRCNENDKPKADTFRSKSKDDPQRTKLSKISSWRRKSEPGLQQNMPSILSKKGQDVDLERHESRGKEKIEFECRNCGSNKISRKNKTCDSALNTDTDIDNFKENSSSKSSVEIKMYNTKNMPKKISKLKKNRAKGIRPGTDTTAKFYADLSTDISTDNILHISESNDSLNLDKPKDCTQNITASSDVIKDDDIDEETYKKLIEKTDSFKKNELEKVKFLNQQKVINEGLENEDKIDEVEIRKNVIAESCEESEQPLEQIISQLLLQNREFQKLLKKQQLRNSAQRRHQRLLKSHSNPEQEGMSKTSEVTKLKPKYARQYSENVSLTNDESHTENISSCSEKNDVGEEDHIYETLRIESRATDALHSLNNKSKSIQHNTKIARPKKLPPPLSPNKNMPVISRNSILESDYVYLSFDQLNILNDKEGIYDVPIKTSEKVNQQEESTDYYVNMEKKDNNADMTEQTLYDTLLDTVCRRKKEVSNDLSGEYLPMGKDQSPNTPEIWLSRQKEHFTVSRDRKSGSLPRSFQVITSSPEDNSLSTFKSKANSSKTYLNRDGKVMSIDRPFTIASDQSEISYDDVENYMNEGEIPKFSKKNKSNEEFSQDISQSTLDLEEEIDRCYKNNFEKIHLTADNNENLLTESQPIVIESMTSSCEVLPLDTIDDKTKTVIHPEHKIYKPTSNILSLKNVLSRFKNKTPTKCNNEEVNANDNSSPDSTKTDIKSPTNEKRTALNPRSYSKNLLQRFKNIIGDEHSDDNQNKADLTTSKEIDSPRNNLHRNNIKVVITNNSPSTSTIVYTTTDALSKSVCDNTTLSESKTEKNCLDKLSQSCDNINEKPESVRPSFDKSISTVTSSSSVSNNSSPSWSANNINKLPIYMQGSKHLGARIAQSDYVDPTTLANEKKTLKNVNILINKNAVRPDSLFSNSSFATLSSEGTYQEPKIIKHANKSDVKEDVRTVKQKTHSSMVVNSDENFYEKSFEKIESIIDEDVFRDSAVYSDQEETEDVRVDVQNRVNSFNKAVTKIESIKRNSSFKSQNISVISKISEKRAVHGKTSNSQHSDKSTTSDQKFITADTSSKIKAPPVPIKPKLTNIPHYKSNLLKCPEQSAPKESSNTKIAKPNAKDNVPKPMSIQRTETPKQFGINAEEKTVKKLKDKTDHDVKSDPPFNIQLKRLSYERASLDSLTRKTKPIRETNEPKRLSATSENTSKTVLERRLELEQITKSHVKTTINVKKPTQIAKPKLITTKVATFERSVSESSPTEARNLRSTLCTDGSNYPRREKSFVILKDDRPDDPKGSWVKQVVNKFQ